VSDAPSTPTPGTPAAGPAPSAPDATAPAAAPVPSPAPVAVLDPPAESPAPDPNSVPAAASAKPPARQVQVPMWLLAVVGILVLVVGAFFVGRSTASETSGPATLADAVEMTASGEMEVGDFEASQLIAALQQNDELDLGVIGRILEDFVSGDGFDSR
jgi:hypothetical protein